MSQRKSAKMIPFVGSDDYETFINRARRTVDPSVGVAKIVKSTSEKTRKKKEEEKKKEGIPVTTDEQKERSVPWYKRLFQ